MGFLAWIVLGLIVGAIVKAVMPGHVGGGWVTSLVLAGARLPARPDIRYLKSNRNTLGPGNPGPLFVHITKQQRQGPACAGSGHWRTGILWRPYPG